MIEYFQTGALAPIEREWVSASDVYRDGTLFVFPESKKLIKEEAIIELDRLRRTYRNLEFKIEPFKGD